MLIVLMCDVRLLGSQTRNKVIYRACIYYITAVQNKLSKENYEEWITDYKHVFFSKK
jgi:type VI protein secretion system component VasF